MGIALLPYGFCARSGKDESLLRRVHLSPRVSESLEYSTGKRGKGTGNVGGSGMAVTRPKRNIVYPFRMNARIGGAPILPSVRYLHCKAHHVAEGMIESPVKIL